MREKKKNNKLVIIILCLIVFTISLGFLITLIDAFLNISAGSLWSEDKILELDKEYCAKKGMVYGTDIGHSLSGSYIIHVCRSQTSTIKINRNDPRYCEISVKGDFGWC